jgi:hypothetical protein
MQPALLSLAGASRCVNRHRGKGAVSVNTKPHLGLDQSGEEKFRGFSFGAAAAPSRAVTSFSFIGFASKFSVRSDKRGPFLGKWLVSTQVERKRRRQANWYSALPTPCLAGVSAQSFFMAFLRTCMGSKRSSSARCSPSSSICSASDRDSSQSSH